MKLLRSLLALGLIPLICGPALAVGIAGTVSNAPALARAFGSENVRILLTSLAQGRIVGLGTLAGNGFELQIPDTFKPPVQPADFCPGVRSVPSEPRTYTAESLMVYQAGRNLAALLTQADHPTEPTRRSQWMYSDRAANVAGRCTGLNTSYNLTLRKGWNAVMTVSEPGSFVIRNATPGLPYWVQNPPIAGARQVFPTVFDGK
ncbi:hypothetical protein E7T06_12735 [Deinococcus sp. Arct2-2]|uniref:hypothetical protein n=1 Tax=Deinococcus sp. Arct2-2 TaxID=2568653 RepID=UPI0010A534EC|nr:hypothetical protein [Deinococcus sp. Arct2-2]THF69245.1 hypothetical protein E7T06_12735 [Deinococcus sp. Arct2-2]